jgi:hypothetical protein
MQCAKIFMYAHIFVGPMYSTSCKNRGFIDYIRAAGSMFEVWEIDVKSTHECSQLLCCWCCCCCC